MDPNTNLIVQAPTRVWGLSDFHLSFGSMPAEMAFVSASNEPPWYKNSRKIAQAWSETVKRNDIVLLPGDISAAKSHASVQRDLAWLSKRAGIAHVLSPGNHDHWFGRMSGVKRILRDNQFAVDGNAIDFGAVIVAGARSQPTPDDPTDLKLDTKSKAQQCVDKLKKSLDQAKALQPVDGPSKPVIVLWHHPPFDRWGRPDPVVELMSQAGVTACVFGHIHTQAQWQSVPQGEIQGIKFACVAADSVGFRPRLILEIPAAG
jgi:predicted phosphohydrolase